MKRSLWPVAALLVVLTTSCGEKTGVAGKTTVHLQVDPEIANLLPDLEGAVFEDGVASAVLSKLDKMRKKWCLAPGKATGLKRNLKDGEIKALKADDFGMRTRLGCSAWYALSDESAERDFAYVRNYFDAALRTPVHCVSVGFMQPYIMGTQLKCSSFTVVDLSFRTMHLHAVLMPLLTSPQFPGIDAVLQDFKKTTGITLNEICGSNKVDRCKITLMAFAEKYRGGLNAKLHLAALSGFRPALGPTPTIVYMSNAPDPYFTSATEFTQLRQNLGSSGGKVIAIYHQAESGNFGVYELTAGKIKTVCADAFVVAEAGRYSKDRCTYYPPSRRNYTTYFDDASENRAEKKTCEL